MTTLLPAAQHGSLSSQAAEHPSAGFPLHSQPYSAIGDCLHTHGSRVLFTAAMLHKDVDGDVPGNSTLRVI